MMCMTINIPLCAKPQGQKQNKEHKNKITFRSGTETTVKFYSLSKNKYVNTLKFKTEVHGISANRRVLVVALRDHLYGFDSVTMEKVINLECFCGPGAVGGILALGPRWLAFPGNLPVITNKNTSTSDKIVEVAKDMAKDIASGLYYLGHKTYTDYIATNEGGEGASRPPSYNPDVQGNFAANQQDYNETSGTVVVFDIVSQKNLAHFKAHSQPISAMSFDPSGSLLVTASVDGRNFNVFQISPESQSNVQSNFKHLYKLQRGMTNASIHSVSFSADSRWLSINSTRGTTHLYAICPNGGTVNINTHLRASNNHRLTPHPLVSDRNPPLVILPSLNRIRSGVADESTSLTPVASATEFMGHPYATERIFVFSQFGILTQYRLIPQPPPPGTDMDPTALQLVVEGLVKWDLCRRTKQAELLWSQDMLKIAINKNENDKNNEYKDGEYVGWLSEVEIYTHSPHIRPLWASPQFSFKTFQAHPEGNGAFFEKVSTKKVEVKHIDPIPHRDRGGLDQSEIYNETEVKSSPPLKIPEDTIKENMLRAMTTPMDDVIGMSSLSIQEDYEDPFEVPSQNNHSRDFQSPNMSSQVVIQEERPLEFNWMDQIESTNYNSPPGNIYNEAYNNNYDNSVHNQPHLRSVQCEDAGNKAQGMPFESGFFASSQLAESDMHGDSQFLQQCLKASVSDED